MRNTVMVEVPGQEDLTSKSIDNIIKDFQYELQQDIRNVGFNCP
jgi:hypothetical protein